LLSIMIEELIYELQFKTSRSGGPGGQHVNKVETRVDLMFDVLNSEYLDEEQKELILERLKNRISKAGILRLQCNKTRSQAENKEIAIGRFYLLIEEALKPEKERKPTKPTKSSVHKRLNEKKKQSEKKDLRKPVSD
jgi:ribosome-associated protein